MMCPSRTLFGRHLVLFSLGLNFVEPLAQNCQGFLVSLDDIIGILWIGPDHGEITVVCSIGKVDDGNIWVVAFQNTALGPPVLLREK